MRLGLLHRPCAWLLAWCFALLASCGGDGVVGSGGTGAPVTGQAVGTVNGFGSVIVDGVAYDDRLAPVVAEIAPGQDAPAAVQLGDRATIDFSTPGVASHIRVDAAIAGPVASVAPGSLVIAGQSVVLNSDPSMGPITQFGGGYTAAGDVQPGDVVAVHAFVVTYGAPVLQATRVDRAAAGAYVRVTGLVTTSAPGSFTLGTLTVDRSQAQVQPAGATLSPGATVTVLAPAASLVMDTPASWRAAAALVRVVAPAPVADVWLSGRVSRLDATAKTFSLGPQVVRWAQASVSPDVALLVRGAYVQVHGSIAADGVLDATSIAVRSANDTSSSELKGNVTALDAVHATFVLRGTRVDASGAQLQGCPAGGLANGLFVEVTGHLGTSGVIADVVQCQSETSGSTVEREGRASAVDTAALTFTLTPQNGSPIVVQWSASTFFSGVTPQTLAGKSVEVEGTFAGSILVARKIEADD